MSYYGITQNSEILALRTALEAALAENRELREEVEATREENRALRDEVEAYDVRECTHSQNLDAVVQERLAKEHQLKLTTGDLNAANRRIQALDKDLHNKDIHIARMATADSSSNTSAGPSSPILYNIDTDDDDTDTDDEDDDVLEEMVGA